MVLVATVSQVRAVRGLRCAIAPCCTPSEAEGANRRPSGPRKEGPDCSPEGRTSVSFQLLDEVVLVVLAVRVLGRDVLALLRRAAAAGVRVGVSELRRGENEDGQE